MYYDILSHLVVLLEEEHGGNRVNQVEVLVAVWDGAPVIVNMDVSKFYHVCATVLGLVQGTVLTQSHCKEEGTYEEDDTGTAD
eukprot:14892256-Ditylum_brightwellii.AAC.1